MEESAPSLPSIWALMHSWFTPTVLFVFLNLMIGTILFTSNLPSNNTHKQEDQNEKTHHQNDLIQSKLARSPSILHRLRSFNLYPHRSHQDSPPVTDHHEQPPTPPQQQALEIAATEFVFDHPFPHEHQPQPVSEISKKLDLNPDDFNHINEVKRNNAQTHFVIDRHTVEKVTTHYDFGPAGIENENPPAPEQDTGSVETRGEESDELQSLDEVYSNIVTGGHVNRTKSDTLPASGEIPVKLPAKMKKSASVKSAFSHFEEDKIVEARRPATVRERRTAAKVTEDDDVEVDAKADDFINKFKHQLKLQRLDSIIRYKDMVNRGTAK